MATTVCCTLWICLISFLIVQCVSQLLDIDDMLDIDPCSITLNHFYPPCKDDPNRKYDFVIVGGGTAGCVLANRLTENPDIHVLLIEAGKYASRRTEIPLEFIRLQETEEDYDFKVSQPGLFKGLNNKLNNWPQGKALGGSSSINAMIYAPGVPADYNSWAELTGDPIWSWDNVEPYFGKLQEYVRTSSYTCERPSRLYLGVGAAELGIPVNGEGIFGYKDHNVTIWENTRYSMAEAYLKPIMNRKNLCVMVERRVTKIIIENYNAVGVEVETPEGGVVTINPGREIIISAGAINTPKLLMLSGIGPYEHLKNFNLDVHADLPVGKNLKDHLIAPFFATMNDAPMLPYNTMLLAYCASGLLLNNIELANFLGYFNTTNTTNRPDLEFIHFEFLMQDTIFLEEYIDKFSIIEEFAWQLRIKNMFHSLLLFLPTLLHPLSKGEVLLKDLDPNTPPIINPHYLEHPEDVQVFIDAINNYIKPMLRTTLFLLNDSELVKFDIDECDELTYESDDYWKCYLSYFAGTIYHPACTCRMGTDRFTSVLNSRLKVWGIDRLRVVDTSAFPELVTGHNNLPACMLAENAADIIKIDNGI